MVLLHALGERGANWAPVAACFAERFLVFALDLRGHGDSDWPGTYSFQLMCDDVLSVIDQLGLGAVTLAGHSMGGTVAYLVAMQRPDRVERLIVEDAPPPFPRDRAVPARPAEPLDFDWAVVPAIISQVNEGDPAAWDGLGTITAPDAAHRRRPAKPHPAGQAGGSASSDSPAGRTGRRLRRGSAAAYGGFSSCG